MNKYDVGALKKRMEVTVKGEKGIVASVHEPEWRDHSTGRQCKELQGADIKINGEYRYYHAADIRPST